jgi:hypothetical protein
MARQNVPIEWQEVTQHSIINIWQRFKTNPKDLLTESDLKCWLFNELINKKTDSSSYSVHTEVTHYSKEEKKKYRYRDLSLLTTNNIELNKELYDKNTDGLSKGFKHKGCALHFELKFLRQDGNDSKLFSDLEKIVNYKSKTNSEFERKFIALIGSHDKLDNEKLLKALQKVKKNQELLVFYCFDTHKLEKWEYQNFKWVCNQINL